MKTTVPTRPVTIRVPTWVAEAVEEVAGSYDLFASSVMGLIVEDWVRIHLDALRNEGVVHSGMEDPGPSRRTLFGENWLGPDSMERGEVIHLGPLGGQDRCDCEVCEIAESE